MEEFSRDYFKQQEELFEQTITFAKVDKNRYSEQTLANLSIMMKDFHKLVAGLMMDIQTGRIHKTPRRFRKWKAKKNTLKKAEEDSNTIEKIDV